MATVREKLYEHIFANGWRLDPTALSRIQKQDPNTFIREAEHGGTWRLSLDFSNGYGQSNTLNSATVGWTSTSRIDILQGRVDPQFERTGVLVNNERKRWRGNSSLWTALGPEEGKKRSLRERAELLATNPDLAVWLMLEVSLREQEILEKEVAARRVEQDRRDRPLPLYEGVSVEVWKKTVSELLDSASRLHSANGVTDVALLVSGLPSLVKRIEVLVDYDLAEERAQVIHVEKAVQ